MARFLKKQEHLKGLGPGSLIFVGQKKMEESLIRLIHYSPDQLDEVTPKSIEEASKFIMPGSVTWINIYGVHDQKLIEQIGNQFNLHPLIMADVMNTGQRSKIEVFGNMIFIVIKMLRLDDDQRVHSEQLSLVMGDDFVITFQEQRGDYFDPLRNRIRTQNRRIRKRSADYLTFAILDVVVDNYFYVIEKVGEEIEEIEENILNRTGKNILDDINRYKQETNYLRKIIRPARETILNLTKKESTYIDKKTIPFLKDLSNNAAHVVEVIDSYRLMLTDQLTIYHTNMTSDLNDIIRVLTIISLVFVPLTFIAGVYGTNFRYFPELDHPYAYYIFWAVLVMISLLMLWYFKRKKWI